MNRRLKQVVVALVVLFAGAQFVRPERSSPPTDASRTIQAHAGMSEVAAVLDRSCGDCHSNASVSSWYAEVAPLSWLMARSVTDGRKAVNFSEWEGYPADVQHALLSASCDDATTGKMPGPYTWFRPTTRLSPRDIETICAAAR